MSLEATIAENTAAIRELIAAIANGTPTAPAQVAAVAAEAPKGKQAKATVANNGASSTPGHTSPTADAAAQDPAAGAAPTAPAAASVTYDEVKAAILKLSQAKGREQVVAALTEFGVAKGPELKPEQFAGFVAKANALVAA